MLQLLSLTQDNTSLLRVIGDLTAQQMKLERELNTQVRAAAAPLGSWRVWWCTQWCPCLPNVGAYPSRVQSITGIHVADSEPGAKQEAEERQRLMQLVKLQASEMEALRMEISVLRRKGGHIFTQST